jgi:hypothetical protein
MELPIWQVDLYVDGPVSMRRRLLTTQQKGFRVECPFYSDIEIHSVPSGLRAMVTARAPDEELGYKAAVFFFGRMLDALALAINRPMFLSLTERERPRSGRHDVRRVIETQELEDAFHEAHQLASSKPSFLRGLGWYRKALCADDPFDKFLAFWNAMEIVAGRYYRYVPTIDRDRAKKGSKSQIWECFKALWGPNSQWPIIPGQDKWIDESYHTRNDVAHGVSSVDIHKVAVVAGRLGTIERVAYRFLRDWRDRMLHADRDPLKEILEKPGEEVMVR